MTRNRTTELELRKELGLRTRAAMNLLERKVHAHGGWNYLGKTTATHAAGLLGWLYGYACKMRNEFHVDPSATAQYSRALCEYLLCGAANKRLEYVPDITVEQKKYGS